MDKIQCPTHFISDHPVEFDAFGSHERVARALQDLICGRNADKVNVIALEGAWGSGKSTVVKILERLSHETSCDTDIAIFVYDTWAYQGDSLRRSFLETLIGFLMRRGWVDKKIWTKKKEVLSRRREETHITTSPQLTGWGKVLAISFGLVPVGMVLATMGGNVIFLCRQVGIGLTLSPILVAVAAKISQSVKNHSFLKNRKANRSSANETKSKEDDWLFLFMQKTKEVQKTKTTRTPDPTAIEFSQTFGQLLQEALGGIRGNRHLMVVMDNLDRLPPEEALQVWATMRTFFELDGGEWQNRLHLLVPYAPEALSRLWENTGGQNTAQAFLEKTFQVRFQVPTPVLSDWNAFLKEQLEFSLPRHQGKPEIDIIIRIFRLKGIPKDRPLTPRDIKLFVNKIGILHSQWGDEIPLSVQAVYALHEQDFQKSPRSLVSGDLLDENVKEILQEPDWQKYFAALHFNVPPEKALQVFIGQQIEKALVEGDAQAIKEHLGVLGLEQVVEEILDRNLSRWFSQLEILTRVSLALQDVPEDSTSWNQVRDRVCNAIEQSNEAFQRFGLKEGEGLRVILRKCKKLTLAQHILQLIQENILAIAEEKGESQKYQKIQSWVQGSYVVLKALLELGLESVVKSFEVPGSPSVYLQVIQILTLENLEKGIAQYFVPSVDGRKVIGELVNTLNQRTLSEGWGRAVGLMTLIGPEWPWQDLVDTANRITNSQPLISLQQWHEVLEALWHIYSLEKVAKSDFHARRVLEQMARDGRVFHYLHASYQDQQWEDIAQNLMTLLALNPKAQHQRNWQNSAIGVQIFERILQQPTAYSEVLEAFVCLAREYMSFREFLTIYHAEGNTHQWIATSLERVLQEHPCFFEPDAIVEEYTVFQSLPQELQENIVRQVRDALIEHLKKTSFSPNFSKLYLQILKAGKSLPSGFMDFLKEGLRELDEELWLKSLNHQFPVFHLLRYLLEIGETPGLKQSFADALLEQIESWIDEHNGPPEENLSGFSNLTDALAERPSRVTFWRNLRDLLIERSERDLSRILMVFGEDLIDSGVLTEKADDIVRRLFREIVDGGQEVELQWMLQVFKKVPDFLGKVPISSLEDLKERLEKAEELPENLISDLEEFKEHIAKEIERRNTGESK